MSTTNLRNFRPHEPFSRGMSAEREHTDTRFPLRSPSGPHGLTAIPGRFSSSSLPPLFVSGRFAAFCTPTHRARPVASR